MVMLTRIFFIFIFVCAAHSSVNDASEGGPFCFRGIDLGFVRSGCPELSPLIGVENPVIAGYRLHGHLRKVQKNVEPLFEQPRNHANCRGFGYEPTDCTSALIERLAPSCAGYLINTSRSDPINAHNWLSPRNVAKILLLTRNPEFFKNTATAREKAFEDLTFLFLPEHILKKALRGKLSAEGAPHSNRGKRRALKLANASQEQWWLRKQPGRVISKAEQKFRQEKSNAFVRLIYGAFVENHGQKGQLSGYTPHMVEQILLSFLWEKHRDTKTAYRPYIEEMVKEEYIYKEDADQIIWDGPKAKYEATDYYAAKKYLASQNAVNRQNLAAQIIVTGNFWARNEVSLREFVTLRRLGFSYFEDPQPPVVGYGTCYREIDGEWEPESDCGESLVWDTMMHMLYNQALKRFEWEKLVEWKTTGCSNLWRDYVTDEFVRFNVNDGLIKFFRDTCPTPQHIKYPHVRNAWGKLLTDLNKQDDPHPIRYLKPDGNPTYAVGPGVYNVLRVLGHLLGDPGWWPAPNHPDLLDYQLTRFCNIASPNSKFYGKTIAGDIFGHDVRTYWDYSLEPFRGRYIIPADPALAKIFRKPRLNTRHLADNLINLVFKKYSRDFGRKTDFKSEETTMFEWRCQPAHFDFVKLGISNPDQISLDKLPPIPDVGSLCELVYSQNLSIFEGRILAIKMIFTFLKQTDNLDMMISDSDEACHFKQLLQRWLEPTGEFFAQWKDSHVRQRVYEVVAAFWSTEDFCQSELTCFFPDLLRDRINARDVVDIQRILTSDLAIREAKLKAQKNECLESKIISHGLLVSLIQDNVKLLPDSPDYRAEVLHLLWLANAEEYLRSFTTGLLEDLFPKHDPYMDIYDN